MTDQAHSKLYPLLALLRVGAWLALCLFGFSWVASYFFGIQHYGSHWSPPGPTASEEARWLISNYGSFGVAWRSQTAYMSSTPADEMQMTTFESGSSAMNHVHPEGFFAWHWIDYDPTRKKKMGLSRSGYGHLYLPYWMPFLASGLLLMFVSTCINTVKIVGATSELPLQNESTNSDQTPIKSQGSRSGPHGSPPNSD